MVPQADKLLEQARLGERLTTRQRRLVISHMIAMNALETNQAMADIFGVSERQIRADKLWIRTDKAQSVKEEDIGLVLADLTFAFESNIRNVERSLKKCKLGSRTYLEHLKTHFKFQLDKIAALQNLGLIPRNLGQMTVAKYEYRAYVNSDNSVETRPVDLVVDVDTEDVPKQKYITQGEDAKRDGDR